MKKPISPDLTITGRGKEEKEMGTPEVVLTKEIPLWEDLETGNGNLMETKKRVLEALSNVLDKNQHPLFDLVLCTFGQGSTGPFVHKIFILGKREVILCNLQKIAKKIASKKTWKKEGVWIHGVWIGLDPFKRPKIEDFT